MQENDARPSSVPDETSSTGLLTKSASPVTVCVVTFRRPAGLARLLAGLDALQFQKSAPPELSILIVDNDPQQSAFALCTEWEPSIRWPLTYVNEPRQGIPQARNSAILHAGDDAQFIAYIDDDEAPDPDWLDELLFVQQQYDADVVVGPVLSRFDSGTPRWIQSFFDRPRHRTGDRMTSANTGNVLISTRPLREWNLSFDERMAFTGGEDTHLFLRMAKLGARIIWADEAIVHEWVPATRTSVGWILQRAYRAGSTWSSCEREIRPSTIVLITRILKALGRIAQGILLLPFALPRGKRAVVRCFRHISWGAGNIAGLLGVQHEEYRQTHGR